VVPMAMKKLTISVSTCMKLSRLRIPKGRC
jgi:hypothetical protein